MILKFWLSRLAGSAVNTPIAHVIVIDDDPVSLASVGDSLRRAGYGVSTFGSATEALAAFEAGSASCAVVAVVMSGTDGIDTIVALRQRDPHLLVIAMSDGRQAMPINVSLQVASAFGANGFLSKPFSHGQLVKCVSEVIENFRK